jgi:hypothetical protein
MSLSPRAIAPKHLFPAGETTVCFSADGETYRDLGLLSGAAFERRRSTRTRWEDQADGTLAPMREDGLSDRLDLLFEAREWNADTLAALFLGTLVGETVDGLTLVPATLSGMAGRAQVSVASPDGPALTWRSAALLGPREGTLALDTSGWLGLPLRLTLIPPFEPCDLEH